MSVQQKHDDDVDDDEDDVNDYDKILMMTTTLRDEMENIQHT